MDYETVIFNVSAFIAGLFLLEYGADKFVDHTAALSARLGIPSILIALLTAGAEWEELAAITAALVQHRPNLALGNVVGSTISNILGAFSIGLLFQSGVTRFDQSSKIYTIISFGVTTIVAALASLHLFNKAIGAVLLGAFVLYVGLVFWSIYHGILSAPKGEESESESDSGSGSGSNTPSVIVDDMDGAAGTTPEPDVARDALTESSPLLPGTRKPGRSTWYHLTQFLIGFLAMSLSGYILSHSSGVLASSFHISESVFGATILSLATTLPEKFVAVLSGSRGQSGILVANTVGSNIFLLTLCLGIILLATENSDGVRVFEVVWMWSASVALAAVVLLGSRKWMGAAMIFAYIVFLILEFSVFRT